MPSSPKIPRERILQTALEMLIAQGYPAISITALAKALNCSTQPISWQFGGMDGLRAALADEALCYINARITAQSGHGLAAFRKVGEMYVDLAIDEPHLFRFVLMGESGRRVEGARLALLDQERSARLMREIAEETGATQPEAANYMQTLILYTHGISSLLAAGVLQKQKADVHAMLCKTGLELTTVLHIPPEKAAKLLQLPFPLQDNTKENDL